MLLACLRAGAILTVLTVLPCLPAAAGWQDTPDALKLQAVGDTLNVNGTPMQIRAFVTELPLETVLKEVQSSWQRGAAPVQRTDTSSWTILNQTVGEQHRSLQLRQKGAGVEGFVALTSPKQARAVALALRLPSDMTAVSVVDSVDQGRASQQVIAVSRRSIAASALSLEAALKAGGWQRQVVKNGKDAIVMAANKGRQQFDATLAAQPTGSMVMMNTIFN